MKKEKVEKTTSITYGNRIAKLRTKKKVVRGGGMSSDFALLVGSFKDTAEVPPERALEMQLEPNLFAKSVHIESPHLRGRAHNSG